MVLISRILVTVMAAVTVMAGSLLVACNGPEQGTRTEPNGGISTIPAPAALPYNIVNVYPHDTTSYTQGLVIHEGQLYEGTGGSPEWSHYKSWVGKVDLSTGAVRQKVPLDPAYFGEGITILNGSIYQLTWTSKKGFVYDLKTLKKLKEFPLKTEGWGLTNDSTHLVVSDGSSNLYFLDPTDFSTFKILGVTDQNGPVNNLNELEYINGYLYANRYQSNQILKIDPSNGQVVGQADMTGLLEKYAPEVASEEKYRNGEGVLNGIAYDAASGKIYITGKLWPKLFEITLQ